MLTPVSSAGVLSILKKYTKSSVLWYAKGLYIKDVLPGSEIRADKAYRVEEADFVYNRLLPGKVPLQSQTQKMPLVVTFRNEFPCFALNRDRAYLLYLWKYFSLVASAWDEALSLRNRWHPNKQKSSEGRKIPSPENSLSPVQSSGGMWCLSEVGG